MDRFFATILKDIKDKTQKINFSKISYKNTGTWTPLDANDSISESQEASELSLNVVEDTNQEFVCKSVKEMD